MSKAELEELATVCTDKQMEVMRMKNDALGIRHIARKLDISTTAVRQRLDGAKINLKRLEDKKRAAESLEAEREAS